MYTYYGAFEEDIDSLSRAPSIVSRVIYAFIEQILFPLLFDILFTHCTFMKYRVRASKRFLLTRDFTFVEGQRLFRNLPRLYDLE